MRNIQFQNDCYYHVFNRGVDKREVFLDDKDFIRFIKSMWEFNQIEPIGSFYEKYNQEINRTSGVQHPIGCWTPQVLLKDRLVEFICFCLNPNHYHFLIKQLIESGISEFMKRLIGGYTNYFNKRNKRKGSLFETTYNAIKVKTDEYLQYLSCYINGNVEIHKISKAKNWPWSSYQDYLGIRQRTLCNTEVILKDFQDVLEYQELADYVIKNSAERKEEIKKYLLE